MDTAGQFFGSIVPFSLHDLCFFALKTLRLSSLFWSILNARALCHSSLLINYSCWLKDEAHLVHLFDLLFEQQC